MRIASILFSLVTWSHSCFLRAQRIFMTCVLATVSPSLCHNDTTDTPLLLYNSHIHHQHFIFFLRHYYLLTTFWPTHSSLTKPLPLIKFGQRNADFHPRKVIRQPGPRIWWDLTGAGAVAERTLAVDRTKRSTAARAILFRSRHLGTRSPSTWLSI